MKVSARKVILSLMLLCCIMSVAKERYYARVLLDGKMYFFMPYKLKGESGNKLQYDMTLISYKDSVTLNMTLHSPMGRVRSVRLSSGDVNYTTTKYELFYQERDRSKFNTRVHIDCPLEMYRKLYTNASPLTIEIVMEDGKKYAFSYKAKQWQKESMYASEVLEMLDYSNSLK